MASERARELRRKAREATGEAVRQFEESGELRHLYGQRLDLGDDSPDWFLHRMLKRDGLSLPLIERGKDIDDAESAAAAIVERLRRRREWLSGPEARLTPAESSRFNEYRERGLAEYRERLVALNKAILDYNLTAPTPLHRRGIIVDHAVARVAADIAPLEATAPTPASPATVSWRDRVRRRLLGARDTDSRRPAPMS